MECAILDSIGNDDNCLYRNLDKGVSNVHRIWQATVRDSDSYTSDDLGNSITNYYFYYNQSMDRKMFVTEDAYKKYQVGDSVPAYTIDHEYYGFTLESLLPQPDYRRNELSKAAGVLIGVGIVILCLMKKIWD